MGGKEMLKKLRLKRIRYRDIRIGWKYGLTLAIVILLFIGSSALVSNSIIGIGKNIEELEAKSDLAMSISEMGSLTHDMSIYIVSYYQEQNPDLVESFKENQVSYNQFASEVRVNLKSKEQEEIYQEVTSMNQEMYRMFTNYIVSAIKNGNMDVAESFLSQTNEIRDETVSLLDELVSMLDADRQQTISSAMESQKKTFVTQLIILAVTIVIGVLLIVFISQAISRNLKKVVEVSNQIAEGDLTVPEVDYDGKDEIGQLASSIGRMSAYLKEVIRQVSLVSNSVTTQSKELKLSASEVRAGSEQVATTMQELAAGSEKQARWCK